MSRAGPAPLWMRAKSDDARSKLRPAGLQVVIAEDLGHPDAIVAEHAGSPLGLGFAMFLMAIPRFHGGTVAPEGKGKEFVFLGQALESLDGNETIDLFHILAQRLGEIEICFLA